MKEIDESLTAGWWLEDGPDEACKRAFGASFRLPSLDEARAALLPRDAPWGGLTLAVRDARGDVRLLRREIDRCQPGDTDCRQFVRVYEIADGPAEVRCVASAAHALPASPNDDEIRSCTHAVTASLTNLNGELPLSLVDESAVDVALAARSACATTDPHDDGLVLDRLQREGQGATLSQRGDAAERASSAAEQSASALREAMATLSAGSLDVQCDGAHEYQRRCEGAAQTPFCVAWQAQYLTRCLAKEPSEILLGAARDIAAARARARRDARRQQTLRLVAGLLQRCITDESLQARLRRIIGGHRRQPEPIPPRDCSCPVDDLGCGVAALREPVSCPERRGPGTPPKAR